LALCKAAIQLPDRYEEPTMTSLVRRFPFLAHLQSQPAGASRLASAVTAKPSETRPVTPDLEQARGAAMRRLFPKLYSWCATRWEWAIATEVHSYLAGATDLADLEQRIRHVERRRHFRP
jgi:hypothetical protein